MPATFTVTLDAGGDARGNRTSVTVTYTTADSTADAPDDYTLPSGTLVIPVNSLTETIEIPTQTDTVLDHETLAVRLTEVTADAGVARLGTPDRVTTTTTIADSGAVDVTVGDISVEEGYPAVFTIEAGRGGGGGRNRRIRDGRRHRRERRAGRPGLYRGGRTAW